MPITLCSGGQEWTGSSERARGSAPHQLVLVEVCQVREEGCQAGSHSSLHSGFSVARQLLQHGQDQRPAHVEGQKAAHPSAAFRHCHAPLCVLVTHLRTLNPDPTLGTTRVSRRCAAAVGNPGMKAEGQGKLSKGLSLELQGQIVQNPN